MKNSPLPRCNLHNLKAIPQRLSMVNMISVQFSSVPDLYAHLWLEMLSLTEIDLKNPCWMIWIIDHVNYPKFVSVNKKRLKSKPAA